MKGVTFSKANMTLSAPPSIPDAYDLPVCKTQTHEGHPLFLSCWELSDAELAEIIKTRRVWLWTMSDSFPPTSIEAQYPWEDCEPSPSV